MATDGNPAAPPAPLLRIGFVAIASILLGFAIQFVILLVRLFGDSFPGVARTITDITQGVTWSFLICFGVGLINAMAKLRPAVAGLLSMLIAPLAVGAAKGAQKVMGGLLSAAESEAVLSLSAIGGLRGVEYGVLGYLLARAARSRTAGLPAFAGIGLGVGIVFGGLITWLTHLAGAPQIAATAINEIVFPMGCAGIVYSSQIAAQQAQLLAAPPPGQAA